jgi:hypothetical protein
MSDKIEYPPNHKVGMVVPVGGSDCAKCKFWDGKDCENKYFRQWNNRSGKIPVAPEKYCCDFFETSKKEA